MKLANLQNIKPYVDSIKVKEINNTVKEWSACFKKTNSGNTFGSDLNPQSFNYSNTLYEGTENDSPFFAGQWWIGSVHCHTFKSVGLFSFGDLKALSLAYENVNISLQNDVTLMLIKQNPYNPIKPDVYAIKIDDFALFKAKLDADMANSEYAAPTEQEIVMNINAELTNIWDDVEPRKSFLQRFGSYGISLYEADNDDLTEWSRLKIAPMAPGGIYSKPCLFQ